MWFLLGEAEPGHTAGDPVNPRTIIDRITPGGQVTEFPLPGPARYARALTAGPEGDLWYLNGSSLGRMTTSGQVTEFPFSVSGDAKPEFMTVGVGGDFWVASQSMLDYGTISRVTPMGGSTNFPIPTRESGVGEIVLGADGNIWFGEGYGRKIGRIAPSGQITEFPVPDQPQGLALGPEGNVWFSQGLGRIGRITPTGEVSIFPVEQGHFESGWPFTSGPDGRVWFYSRSNVFGRISPAGRVSYVRLPDPTGNLVSAAEGPDGSLWYTADGEPPCEGGGSCGFITRHSTPGVVGRIFPGALAVRLGGSRSSVRGRWTRVSISCEGGTAESVCKGGIRLRQGRFALGRRRYHLNADETSVFKVRLNRPGAARLHRKGRLAVKATATLAEGKRASRVLVLRLSS